MNRPNRPTAAVKKFELDGILREEGQALYIAQRKKGMTHSQALKAVVNHVFGRTLRAYEARKLAR